MKADDIQKVAKNYHNWQQVGFENTYKNISEFCYSAHIDEVRKNDYSLVPSKYIEIVDRDSNIDFDTEVQRIQKEFKELLAEEEASKNKLKEAFISLGYEI